MLEKIIEEIEVPDDILGVIFGIHFGANVPTINGRTYEKATWEKWIEKLYDPSYLWNIPDGKCIGQIGHHPGRPGADELYAGKISHCTRAMWMEGDLGFAISFVGDNEEGRKLKSYYNMGIKLYPSSRGKLTKKVSLVTPDVYTFYCFDYVFEPSYPLSNIVFIDIKKFKEMQNGTTSLPDLKVA